MEPGLEYLAPRLEEQYLGNCVYGNFIDPEGFFDVFIRAVPAPGPLRAALGREPTPPEIRQYWLERWGGRINTIEICLALASLYGRNPQLEPKIAPAAVGLTSLPPEVLGEVLQYLRPAERGQVAQACRRLGSVVGGRPEVRRRERRLIESDTDTASLVAWYFLSVAAADGVLSEFRTAPGPSEAQIRLRYEPASPSAAPILYDWPPRLPYPSLRGDPLNVTLYSPVRPLYYPSDALIVRGEIVFADLAAAHRYVVSLLLAGQALRMERPRRRQAAFAPPALECVVFGRTARPWRTVAGWENVFRRSAGTATLMQEVVARTPWRQLYPGPPPPLPAASSATA